MPTINVGRKQGGKRKRPAELDHGHPRPQRAIMAAYHSIGLDDPSDSEQADREEISPTPKLRRSVRGKNANVVDLTRAESGIPQPTGIFRNKEPKESISKARTSHKHKEDSKSSNAREPSQGPTALKHKEDPRSHNQAKTCAEVREMIDQTGDEIASSQISVDEWRHQVGLPPIKRANVDLTQVDEQQK